ncbi:hypothetical protein ACS0PU_011869 [Formica fusca]
MHRESHGEVAERKRGETKAKDSERKKERERDSKRQAQSPRKPGRRELHRNNYRSKSSKSWLLLRRIFPHPPTKSFIIKAKLAAFGPRRNGSSSRVDPRDHRRDHLGEFATRPHRIPIRIEPHRHEGKGGGKSSKPFQLSFRTF